MVYKKLAIATLAVLGLQMNSYATEKSHNSDKADAKTESHHAIWTYEGKTGPAHWGSLSEKYALCSTGKQQSPIDISKSTKTDLPQLEFNYNPFPLVIANNGHTIGVVTDKGGLLKIGEESYKLWQFHTHAPSEGTINGKHADMVIHFVHVNAQNKDQLKFAVVGVYLEKGKTANPLIETLWKVMPKTASEEPQKHDIQIDAKQLLPQDKNYYTFTGSLTTPPCWEGIKWMILKQPVSISAEQLAQYHALYPHNARPLQPLNGREVLSSN
ncbi:carbonic anhydrase family protein [Candidatus Parabeggiatoa sp. HSG14]|uniref:carbonic anhydrase n=1 Tax=Candidatus Parabeggiatoa sp. HSG14 TaxID=3055593 RepID=UPI0025A71701|nr:carbonic anhydrase family protein [Thiotrichales bacterium HSG14]